MTSSEPRHPTPPKRVELALTIDPAGWTERIRRLRPMLRRVAATTIAHTGSDRPVEISLVLTDDARVRVLNRDFRGQNKATNVLAFPGEGGDLTAADDAPLLIGDLVVALETTESEARARGKAMSDHVCHLVVHGILHLLGYDHTHEADAEAMEAAERAILARLGVADPYVQGAADRFGSTMTTGDERSTTI